MKTTFYILLSLVIIVCISKLADENNVYGLTIAAYSVGLTIYHWKTREELCEYIKQFRHGREIIQKELYPEERGNG
jgi:predicted membrane channel-forming protein YqfA (hemolysin III family)